MGVMGVMGRDRGVGGVGGDESAFSFAVRCGWMMDPALP